jgi:anthranilate 1,2-dioxygenase small subunit
MTGIERSFDRSSRASDMPGAMAYGLPPLHTGTGSTMTGGTNSRPARSGADGATVTYGSKRYLDEIASKDGTPLLRKRIVVFDSSRIDTLLVIPL